MLSNAKSQLGRRKVNKTSFWLLTWNCPTTACLQLPWHFWHFVERWGRQLRPWQLPIACTRKIYHKLNFGPGSCLYERTLLWSWLAFNVLLIGVFLSHYFPMYCYLPHPCSDQFREEDTIRELVVHHNCLFPHVSSDLPQLNLPPVESASRSRNLPPPSLSFSKHVNCERGHDVAELFMNRRPMPRSTLRRLRIYEPRVWDVLT